MAHGAPPGRLTGPSIFGISLTSASTATRTFIGGESCAARARESPVPGSAIAAYDDFESPGFQLRPHHPARQPSQPGTGDGRIRNCLQIIEAETDFHLEARNSSPSLPIHSPATARPALR